MTRNLLSRAFERSSLIADQYRALHDATKDRDDFTMPRRSTDPYDPHEEARQLRGLPVVGVKGGFGGAIKGTRPGDGIKL